MWILLLIPAAWFAYTELQAKSHHQTLREVLHAQKIALQHFLHIGAAGNADEVQAHAQAAVDAMAQAGQKIAEAVSKSGTDAQKAQTIAARQVLDGTQDLVAAMQAMTAASSDAARAAAQAALDAANQKIAAGQHALVAAGVKV